jgi:hypothetical protein
MQAGEFVFAPQARSGLMPCGCREEWNGSRAIRKEQWWKNLRQAATWAGLRQELMSYHVLRNTAGYRRLQRGDGVEEVQAFLNMKRLYYAKMFVRNIRNTEKQPLWAEPDPDRPRERQPYGHDWKTVVKAQVLIPAPQEQGIEVLEAQPPLLALQTGIAQIRLIRDDLLVKCLPQVEDSRNLAAIMHGVNRASNGIRALLPMFKKALEKQTYEEADRRRIMELLERIQKGEQDGEEEG